MRTNMSWGNSEPLYTAATNEISQTVNKSYEITFIRNTETQTVDEARDYVLNYINSPDQLCLTIDKSWITDKAVLEIMEALGWVVKIKLSPFNFSAVVHPASIASKYPDVRLNAEFAEKYVMELTWE